MNEQAHIVRLRALLARRRRPDPQKRQAVAAARRDRTKGAFWGMTVGVLFLAGVALTALGYGIAGRAGLLPSSPVSVVPDLRWGNRYNAPDAPITSMAVRDGRLFIGTAGNGLHAFDTATRLWNTYRRGRDARILPEDAIRRVKVDARSRTGIWALTRHGGLSVSRDGLRWRTRFGATPFPGTGPAPFTTAARNGRVIAVGTARQGLGIYDVRTKDWVAHLTRVTAPRLPSDRIRTVRAGRDDGTFWAGTAQGVAQLRDNRVARTWLADAPARDVVDLEADADGVWYLTGGARVSLGHIDDEGGMAVRMQAGPPPVAPAEWTSAVQDGEALWVGTRQDGLLRYDLPAHRWQRMEIPASDSTSMTGVTALAYNTRTKELLVGGDDGLHILSRSQALENVPAGTPVRTTFRAIRKMRNDGARTFLLTDTGKFGVRRPEPEKGRGAWWRFLRKPAPGDPDITTLVDVSAAGFDAEEVSAACQSSDRLYFGTIRGEIAWYDKKTHAWSSLAIAMPHAIDQLVHNPSTGSTVALSGHALYRSPPGSDIFILYLNVAAERIEIFPTASGYLLFIDAKMLVHFDDATNRRTILLDGRPAAEPDFRPVSIERVGAGIFFVTRTGHVLTYDTLLRRWDIPDDIFDTGVTDLRRVGHRVVYQTTKRSLYGSGGNTLIGGGSLSVPEARIRHAAERRHTLWVAGDRVIDKYNMATHTWMERDRITVRDGGSVSRLLPLGRRLAYRTGMPGRADGTLWFERRRLDNGVGEVARAHDTLWYVKEGRVSRWTTGMKTPRRVLGGGIPKRPGERLVSAADFDDRLWMATTRRLLVYSQSTRRWRPYPLPGGSPVRSLHAAGSALYAGTDGALYRRRRGEGGWTRISPPGRRVRDAAFASSGAVMLLENGYLLSRPTRKGQPPDLNLTPNDTPVPFALNAIHAARRTSSSLYVAAADYLFRYDMARHAWDRPLRLSRHAVRRAIIQDNRVWASDADGRIFTALLSGRRSSKIEERKPPRFIRDRLGRRDDAVWIDTPFWRWERRQGEVSVMLKTRQGAIPLVPSAGVPFSRFPFDRIHSVAYDGSYIWMTTEAGILRIPEGSRNPIDDLRLYPAVEGPGEVVAPASPGRERRVVYRTAGPRPRYFRFDAAHRYFETLSVKPGGFDPFEDRVLIDTPLWRWERRGGTVTAAFVRPDIRDRRVFETGTARWRFRFDHARSIATRNSDLYVVSDGLLCHYDPGDTSFALGSMTPAPGPAIAPGAQVETIVRDDGTVYLRIREAARAPRIYRSRATGTSRRLEAVEDAGGLFRTDTLVDDGFWRWERDRKTGRVSKYLLAPGSEAQPFRMTHGRFPFDDIRSFTVDDDFIWLATSGGIARYPASASRLPAGALHFERRIAGRTDPAVSLINIRNDTLYCALPGIGVYARPRAGGAWRAVPAGVHPWLRQPVATPFWTWTHDLKRGTVSGVYRDAHGAVKPVTWPSGRFTFDTVSHVLWDRNAFWLDTGAGMSFYPDHGPLLSLDSLRVYPALSGLTRLFAVPDGMPAPPGVYGAQGGRLYRFQGGKDTWERVTRKALPARPAYPAWTYLQDRLEYDILVDYDGFWRCRRRTPHENPKQVPAVLLETRHGGGWQPVSLDDGRFDFDDVRDFTIEGTSYLWLATRAGICRYDLRRPRLDLKSMLFFWGPRYADATDVARFKEEGADRLVFRRGRNNDTLIELDLRHPVPRSLPAYDSPFTVKTQVRTPYWRWTRQERFRGSVASGHRMAVELRAASGAWIPIDLTGVGTGRPLPFDAATSMASYREAIWLSTPAGVFRYPVDRPMTLAHAVFYPADGNLRQARRLVVTGAGGREKMLVCETDAGHTRRLFYLDARGTWQEIAGRSTLDVLRFREGDWYWYEQEGRTAIYFQDDRTRPRPLFGRRFADGYIRSVVMDGGAAWCLTPAGLFRYARESEDGAWRLSRWVAWEDVRGTPSARREDMRASYSFLIDRQAFWILTPRGIARIRRNEAKDGFDFAGYTPFDGIAGRVVDGYFTRDASGAVMASLRFSDDLYHGPARFSVTPRGDDLLIVPRPSVGNARLRAALARARTAFPDLRPASIVSMDEDDTQVWIATPDRVYRVDKARAGMSSGRK